VTVRELALALRRRNRHCFRRHRRDDLFGCVHGALDIELALRMLALLLMCRRWRLVRCRYGSDRRPKLARLGKCALVRGPFDRPFAAIAATAASPASAAPAFAMLLRAAGRPRRRFRQHARGLGNRLTFAPLARGAWLPGALALRSGILTLPVLVATWLARIVATWLARIVATWLTHFVSTWLTHFVSTPLTCCIPVTVTPFVAPLAFAARLATCFVVTLA
jgi:hypothetical protein